jgi:hypothetical protein
VRVAAYWLYWLVYQLVNIPLMALGVPIVAVLAATRSYKMRFSRNPLFKGVLVTAWKFEPLTLVWGNDEDGVLPYGQFMLDRDSRLRAFVWCAIRNPVNNLRLLPLASGVLPEDARFSKLGPLTIATSGPYQAIHIGTRRFGWLVPPGAQRGWRTWPVAF